MTTYEARLQNDYLLFLKEASDYYMAHGDVFTTLRNLTRHLDDEKIAYALVGGLALAAHGFVRMTQDVDLLMTPDGLETFKQRFLGRGYPAGIFRRTQDLSGHRNTGAHRDFGDRRLSRRRQAQAGCLSRPGQRFHRARGHARHCAGNADRTEIGLRHERAAPLARPGRRAGFDRDA